MVLVRIAHFKIVTKNLVVFDSKISDACPLSVLFFKLCKPVFSVGLCLAQVINIFVKAFFYDASFTNQYGRLITNGIFDSLIDVLETINLLVNLF